MGCLVQIRIIFIFRLSLILALTSCGPKPVGVQKSEAAVSAANVKISRSPTGMTIEWDRCTEFGVKRCGNKIKVASVTVISLNCKAGGGYFDAREAQVVDDAEAEKHAMWAITAAPGVGNHLVSPLVYGDPQEGTGAMVTVPPKQLADGCNFIVTLTVMGAKGSQEMITREFELED